jgi:hypothetical protein
MLSLLLLLALLCSASAPDPLACKLHKHWALSVREHEGRVSSQYGQDGALEFVFKMIGTTDRFYVEYGFNAPDFEHGTGANTHELYKKGWTGLLLDGTNDNPAINLHKAFITSTTVLEIFMAHNVSREFDFLSNDLDSADLWVLRAVLTHYKPRVVLAEFNCNFPFESTLTNHPDTGWHGNVYGASLRAFSMLADEFGYVILDVIGHDLLLLRRDLLCGSDFPPLEQWRPHTRQAMHAAHGFTRDELSMKLVDYSVWKASNENMTAAQGQIVLDEVDAMGIFTRFDGHVT